jgi:hypothetical protein
MRKNENWEVEKKGVGGFTFVELVFSIGVIILVSATISGALIAVLKIYVSQATRTDIRFALSMALEKDMVRVLHPAKAFLARYVSNNDNLLDSLRFTVREAGVDNSYAYYFFNPLDTCPPVYNQPFYELRRVPLTGGINGTFACGAGRRLLTNVVTPPTSTIKIRNVIPWMVVFEIFIRQRDEQFTIRSASTPRNVV